MNTLPERHFFLWQNINWAIFQLLWNCWSTALQARFPLMQRGNSQMPQGQRLWWGQKDVPSKWFQSCVSPVLMYESGRCRVTKPLCHVSWPLPVIFPSMHDLNLSMLMIVFFFLVGSTSSNVCNSSSLHFCLSHWNGHF